MNELSQHFHAQACNNAWANLRLLRACAALDDVEFAAQRADHVQREPLVRVLAHLFQHQIHHRGQAHAMLASTAVAPPQLDEFFLAEEAPLRAEELLALGLHEADIWPER
jgi:uncharacterized damage-inducible protein DinB